MQILELNLRKIRKKNVNFHGFNFYKSLYKSNLLVSVQTYEAFIQKTAEYYCFFLMKTMDSISLCPNVFHKVEIFLMYMELHQTIKTQKGSCIKAIAHEK